MKVLLLVSLVAAAYGEADPGFAYHTGYFPYLHAPLAHTYVAAPGCQNEAGAAVPCAHPYFPYPGLLVAAPAVKAAEAADSGVEEARKKREADSAVLASTTHVVNPAPVVLGYHGLGLHGVYGVHGVHGLGYGLAYRHSCPFCFGYPVGFPPFAPAATGEDGSVEEARKKREADADPYLLYGHGGYGYAGYGGHHYSGYAGWPYAYTYAHHGGCTNYLGAHVPCA